MADSSTPAARLVALLNLLSQRGPRGATPSEIEAAIPDYMGKHRDVLSRDMRQANEAGWLIRTVRDGRPDDDSQEAAYRLHRRDPRLAVLLTEQERLLLSRAILMAGLNHEVVEEPDAAADGESGTVLEPGARDAIATVDQLLQATRRRQEIEFDYLGRRRRLRPHAVRLGLGGWWLDGFDPEAVGARSFAVSTLESLSVGPPEQFELPEKRLRLGEPIHWQVDDPVEAEVEVAAPWLEQARATLGPLSLAAASRVAADEGRARYRVRVTNQVAFMAALLALGTAARPVAPPELVARIRDTLTRIANPGGAVPHV